MATGYEKYYVCINEELVRVDPYALYQTYAASGFPTFYAYTDGKVMEVDPYANMNLTSGQTQVARGKRRQTQQLNYPNQYNQVQDLCGSIEPPSFEIVGQSTNYVSYPGEGTTSAILAADTDSLGLTVQTTQQQFGSSRLREMLLDTPTQPGTPKYISQSPISNASPIISHQPQTPTSKNLAQQSQNTAPKPALPCLTAQDVISTVNQMSQETITVGANPSPTLRVLALPQINIELYRRIYNYIMNDFDTLKDKFKPDISYLCDSYKKTISKSSSTTAENTRLIITLILNNLETSLGFAKITQITGGKVLYLPKERIDIVLQKAHFKASSTASNPLLRIGSCVLVRIIQGHVGNWETVLNALEYDLERSCGEKNLRGRLQVLLELTIQSLRDLARLLVRDAVPGTIQQYDNRKNYYAIDSTLVTNWLAMEPTL